MKFLNLTLRFRCYFEQLIFEEETNPETRNPQFGSTELTNADAYTPDDKRDLSSQTEWDLLEPIE